MEISDIPREANTRHATARSPSPVLGSANVGAVAGLVFLVVLVASILVDAGSGIAPGL